MFSHKVLLTYFNAMLKSCHVGGKRGPDVLYDVVRALSWKYLLLCNRLNSKPTEILIKFLQTSTCAQVDPK